MIDSKYDCNEPEFIKPDKKQDGILKLGVVDGVDIFYDSHHPDQTLTVELNKDKTEMVYIISPYDDITIFEGIKKNIIISEKPITLEKKNKVMKYKHEDGTPFTKEEFLQKLKTDKEFNNEFGNKGIDQIANLINDLKTNPDSRRLMVNAWNVGELNKMVLPPCHYGFQIYTRELTMVERMNWWFKNHLPNRDVVDFVDESPEVEKLKYLDEIGVPKRAISLMWNQRSVDTFLGLPFNIASYGLLLCILGEIVNMVPEELIGNLGDVHLYNNHIDQAKEQLGMLGDIRTPYSLPTLRINTEFWVPSTDEGRSIGAGAYTSDFNGLVKSMEISDFQLENYQSHPAIKAPLSN